MVSPTAVKAVTAMACSSAVSMWALAFSLSFGLSECHFSVPLRIHPGKYNLSARVNVSQLHRVALKPDGSGLSFASDPTGTVNFLDMVGNLQGDSGRGYYIEMLVGTPGQKVPRHTAHVPLYITFIYHLKHFAQVF